MATKKKTAAKKKMTKRAATTSTSPSPKEAGPDDVKTVKKKGPPKGTFDYSAFATVVAGKPEKAGEPTPVEVLKFVDENVIGHSTGVISSQSIAMDKAIGIGGFPRGRLIEISGEESTGKSTTVAHAIAEVQRMGGVAMIVDTEEKFDLHYVSSIGVNVADLIVIQPRRKTFESVIEAIKRACDYWISQELRSIPLLIAWDSVGSTPTQSEYDKEADEAQAPGRAAKLLKGAMRTLPERLARSQAVLLAVNHFYTSIQTGFKAKFGSKKVTYGGIAIRYSATLRIELIRVGAVKLADETLLGSEVLIKVNKNNVAAPMNNQIVAILWGIGFDDYVTTFWKLFAHKYITVGGSWYTFATAEGVDVKFQNSFIGWRARCDEDPALWTYARKIFAALP